MYTRTCVYYTLDTINARIMQCRLCIIYYTMDTITQHGTEYFNFNYQHLLRQFIQPVTAIQSWSTIEKITLLLNTVIDIVPFSDTSDTAYPSASNNMGHTAFTETLA